MKKPNQICIAILLICASCSIEQPSAAELYGVNLRPPAQTRTRVAVNRYRTATKTADEDLSCFCNPGIYSVVYLTGHNLSAVNKHDTATMAQKNMKFEPSIIVVRVGSTVEFPNLDPYFHNVFSYSKTKKFDLGRYTQGKTSVVTFDKPGIVKVFCEIHSSMRAYVHVLETPYFNVSNEKGAFHLTNIPPGDYILHVWQESLKDFSQPITIDSDSIFVEVRP